MLNLALNGPLADIFAPAAIALYRPVSVRVAWNPFIQEFTGELLPGAKVRLRISPPGERAMSFTPTVTAVDEGRRLEWRGHLGVPGSFDGWHSFTLQAEGAASTRLTQAERFTGCLVPFTRATLRRTAAGFEAMNEAMATEAAARLTAPVAPPVRRPGPPPG